MVMLFEGSLYVNHDVFVTSEGQEQAINLGPLVANLIRLMPAMASTPLGSLGVVTYTQHPAAL